MSQIIELTVDDKKIYVEVSEDLEEPEPSIMETGGKIPKDFSSLLENLVPFSNKFVEFVNSFSQKPSSSSIEFGLKFSAKGNIIIAEASGEASVKITLNWKDN